MSALIRVALSQKELQIEPGQKGELVVTIQNLGEIVDQYFIEIDGLSAGWYIIPVPEVSLFPQDQDMVRISLHPPAGSEAKGGKYDFSVRVTSREMSTERTSVQATLEILSILRLEVGLSPQRKATTKEGVFQVRLANPGNVDLDVDLEATDPEEGCHYRFEPGSVRIGAGQSKGVSLVVTPKKGPPKGEAKRYDFTVKATPRVAPTQTKVVVGQLEHQERKPLLPRWVVPAAVVALLLLFCCAISVAGVAIFGEDLEALIETVAARPTPYLDEWERMMWSATQTAMSATQTAQATPSPGPTDTPAATAMPGAPAVEFFTADPETITEGESSTLSWGSATNATGVEIDQGIGVVVTPGSVVVSPASTTTYVMTAAGPGGTATLSVRVTVRPPTPSPPPVEVVLNSEAALDGFRCNNRGGNEGIHIEAGNGRFVGSPLYELVCRGFVTFDLSVLSPGAIVTDATLRFYEYDHEGDVGGLGNLVAQHLDYGSSLGSEDYDLTPFAEETVRMPTPSDLWYQVDVTSFVQDDLTRGRSRTQIRLRFHTETDGDGDEDWIYIESGEDYGGTGRRPLLRLMVISP